MTDHGITRKVTMIVAAFSLLLLVGCSKPPTKEIEAADKAMLEAQQKEADLYAHDLYAKAEEALKSAKDLIVTKKYKEAKAAAESVVGLAQEAVGAVGANKERMKAEAEQTLIKIQNAMNELKTSVVKAIKKKVQIDREEIQAAIGKWEIDLVTIKEQLQGGKVRQVHDSLKQMEGQVTAKQESITAAMEPKQK
jgi:hypothetical protein